MLVRPKALISRRLDSLRSLAAAAGAMIREWLSTNARFSRKNRENRQGRYTQCPKCRRTGDYSIRWVRRSKKDRLPPGADEADRAKFAKLRDYLLRLDDEVTCKACGKKFEIPSQHSLMFVDQLAGLPNDEDLEREIAAASGEPEPAPRSSRRCPRGSRANRVAGSNTRDQK